MIKPLTSLRIFFAFAVFFSHLEFFSKNDLFFKTLYSEIFYEGYLGVSFFFILSGFVLSLSYKNRFKEKSITYKNYFIARVARIYPLHLLTMAVSLPFMFSLFVKSKLLFGLKLLVNIVLLQSWVPNQNYYFSFNAPSWSISDEFFFYTIFPILLLLVKYIWKRKYLILSSLLIPILIFFFPRLNQHDWFYVNPLLRSFDFLIGMLLYSLYERDYLRPKSKANGTIKELVAIGIFICFFVLHKYIPQGYRYSCYYWVPMSFIVFIFSYSSGIISDVLSNKYLVLGGEISFGFYMVHQLIIKYVVFINTKMGLLNNNYILIMIILIVTTLCSYFLFKLYEVPANKFIKNYFNKRTKQSLIVTQQKSVVV